MTIKAVANIVGMSWNTVKQINKERLRRKYGRPRLDGLRLIGIDEFAVRKGHVYMMIVVDLETGHVVYVGEGRGKDALDGFWKRLARSKCRIEAVSTDLSGAFFSAVREHLPETTLIFDHFHVVKLANDTLDKVRIMSGGAAQRLKKVLEDNADLATSCYLKEELRRVWNQADKVTASVILINWINEARASGIRLMMRLCRYDSAA